MIEVDSTMPNRSKKRRGIIQSVDRAARILEALAGGPRRLGVSELADRLGLSRPTVHGLLQTLQAHGFVEQDRDPDKYQPGAGPPPLGKPCSASPAWRRPSSTTQVTPSARSELSATPIASSPAPRRAASLPLSWKRRAASRANSVRAAGPAVPSSEPALRWGRRVRPWRR